MCACVLVCLCACAHNVAYVHNVVTSHMCRTSPMAMTPPACMCERMRERMRKCMCIWTGRVCVSDAYYAYACMYACAYACAYACMYACMYACVYACMYACARAMNMHAHMGARPARAHASMGPFAYAHACWSVGRYVTTALVHMRACMRAGYV